MRLKSAQIPYSNLIYNKND